MSTATAVAARPSRFHSRASASECSLTPPVRSAGVDSPEAKARRIVRRVRPRPEATGECSTRGRARAAGPERCGRTWSRAVERKMREAAGDRTRARLTCLRSGVSLLFGISGLEPQGMGSTNVSSLGNATQLRQSPTRAGRGNSPAGKARRRLKDGGVSRRGRDRQIMGRGRQAHEQPHTEGAARSGHRRSSRWRRSRLSRRRAAGPTPRRSPAISLDKTGAATAKAGDTFTYSFAVTNTGNVTLTNVELTDDKCQDTLTRDPAETDEAFDPGDVWHYTCTVVAPDGPGRGAQRGHGHRQVVVQVQDQDGRGDRRPHVHRRRRRPRR